MGGGTSQKLESPGVRMRHGACRRGGEVGGCVRAGGVRACVREAGVGGGGGARQILGVRILFLMYFGIL